MDLNIIARLAAYAEDLAAADLRIADLEAERDAYQRIAHAALDQLHLMTKALDHARARRHRLAERIRTPRQHEQRAA